MHVQNESEQIHVLGIRYR